SIDSIAQVLQAAMGGADTARLHAQRQISMSNMRGIGQSLYIYAQTHGDSFPPDLAEVVRGGMIGVQQLTSPYDGAGPTSADDVAEKCAYIYRPGFRTSDDPTQVVAAERSVQAGEGASFLCLDGHVEFVAEPRASELIAKIQSGEKSIHIAPDK